MNSKTLKKWEKAVKEVNGLMPKFNAVLDSFNKGEITETQLYETGMPIIITLLQNYGAQTTYAEAFMQVQLAEIRSLESQVESYREFIKAEGLQLRFDQFTYGRRRIKK